MKEHPQTHKFISGVSLTNSSDGLVRETPLVGETPLEIYEAVGALSPDGLVANKFMVGALSSDGLVGDSTNKFMGP